MSRVTRTMSITVIALSVALLGGAWLTSIALTSDISVPPPPEPARTIAPPIARAPAPEREPLPVPSPEPDPVRAPPPPLAAVEPPPAPVAIAPAAQPDSEFASEHSAEVDRAWELAFGAKTNPWKWRQAARIFSDCLAEVPTNQRCRQGLAAVQPLIQSTKTVRHPGLYDPAPVQPPGRGGRDPSEE